MQSINRRRGKSFMTGQLNRQSDASLLNQPLWLDAPDAAQRTSVARVPEHMRKAAMDLITKGFTVLRGVQDPAVCQQAIADFGRFCQEHPDQHAASFDEHGRERRLVNFHHYSDAAMQLGTNSDLMELLDFLFAAEASVYTSLTFKYGTQQPVHRDTPHFATWPDGYFFGVWVALEDIDPEAGPLFYYEGGHRFPIDVEGIWKRVCESRPDLSRDEALILALDIYNGYVIDNAPSFGDHRVADMKRGDVAIWHPQLPHGGSPAADPSKSRWSMVFHCAPSEKQVHQHTSFFTHANGEEPAPRYGFTQHYGRNVARAGDVAFQ